MERRSAVTPDGSVVTHEQLEQLLDALEAVREGNFTVRLNARRSGIMGEIASALNGVVDRNNQMTKELSRVSRVIGREGRMTERFKLTGAGGAWLDRVDAINSLIDDLRRPTTEVARVLTAVAEGDLGQKMALEIEGQPVKGEFLRIGTAVNSMVDQLSSFAEEVTRVAREVGTEGSLGGQARVKGVSGTWKDLTDSVNGMASNLTDQVRNISYVATAVARGDLSQKITVEAKGEVAALADTINTMTDQLSAFADEVTRVAREVGTEGKLGGQAEVQGVSGTWKDLTENVNLMASNLTNQVRSIASVASAVAEGDLTQQITVEAKGEVAALADTINKMVDQLSSFADEVTRVAREVGTEGKLGGQAQVKGVSGTWKDLTENVNLMADNLTAQVRDIAQVTTAVAKGDLSQKITVDVRGEILELKNTINTMVDQLSSFADEVTRVAREVGTEGRLGGQAEVKGVSGTWRGLTENVNFMASNLTDQVRNITQVATAVAKGDLGQRISVETKGEVATLADTINSMTDTLRLFADEVIRVAREVGTDGILGGQAQVEGVAGTWKDLTDSVNGMASNLTSQVRSISQVATAVAHGDLSQEITVEARGEVATLAATINTMTNTLRAFADEVTRVAREVGTEGRLGGQAQVEGVAGTWKDLTDSVNGMASNLTDQVRNIAQVTTAVANGDLGQKITVDARGEISELKQTINTMVGQLGSFADEVTRVAREVGTEGKLGGQAQVGGVSGTWKDLTQNVNFMASNLTSQVRNIAHVATAVARGDLGQKITVDAKGEIAELKQTLNVMVDQLSSFADEVTRVAREVGTEGKLGGQAQVKGVAGTWKDLTDSVNGMGSNLTAQVRDIAQVTTAVAGGDLSQKITVDVKGEMLELKKTINTMVDQLSSFADEVTRVAREVGTEGRLGGQAEVKGVAGTWKGLTENVNQLAGNLTTQVRAIAEVSKAVTEGDLTRRIDVEAKGEVGALADTINKMTDTLRETTRVNQEQDWLKTNLANIQRLMQGQRSLQMVSKLIMSELTPTVTAQHGAFFLTDTDDEDKPVLKLIASYGYKARKSVSNTFAFGESLVGQCALERKSIVITEAPSDYIKVSSGLGESAPVNIIVIPILFEDGVLGVIELGSLKPFSAIDQQFLEQLIEVIGVVINSIIANMRTEELLQQSQRLTEELQSQSEELQSQQEELKHSNTELEAQAQSLKASEELLQTQQEELQQTNEELQEKAALLANQNRNIEIKNREIEQARLSLEEKAQQLALSSKYKSEFLANMSHELRTPLNSLLILAKLLSDNSEDNLSAKQVEFARTIHTAGSDLLALISDILDLSKIEAGKMDVHPTEIDLGDIKEYVEQAFNPLAQEKGLVFEVEVGDDAPAAIFTDQQRLQQVIKNLLSNAIKFTDIGSVKLELHTAPSQQTFVNEALNRAESVVAVSVRDTGIGVPADKLRLIFEAFQQADGTTSRKYGGTGLGLSISREIAVLLGGEIRAESTEGEGSSFTLFLPLRYESGAQDVRTATDVVVVEAGGGAVAAPVPAALEPARAPADDLVPEVLAEPDAEMVKAGIEDDRRRIAPGDRTMLAIQSDPTFAKEALAAARSSGYRVILSARGETGAALAREVRPTAIMLDTILPVTGGLTVLQHLKRDSSTRHIPVLVISDENRRQEALKSGAFAYLDKPVKPKDLTACIDEMTSFIERDARTLLIVEDDPTERQSLVELIGAEEPDVDVVATGSSKQALEELDKGSIDCMVLDLKLPDMGGFDLLEKVKKEERFNDLPVIVYTGRDLTRREETRLRKYAQSIIAKDVSSPERLLDETALFLHRVEARMPTEQRRMLEQLHGADVVFRDKKVLVVDDDVRNVFALTSALESRGMSVVFAENGKEGLATLKKNADVDLILMDIMMPEMDGYEAMRAVRVMPQHATLPIIALTAKAMKGDREKSIAAGASDYIKKPVDMDQLFSLMRVWLYE
ncbi:MAG: HAMP domain-containing protein [Actinomycetota bacterium]|nr:HAMP domain-containing protein [Actinomycetota bacterium]